MGLIKITNQNGQQVVSARELHQFLEIKTPFKDWINRMFQYGFVENQDYTRVLNFERGGNDAKEYALTLDTAKEISMIQRSDKGQQARRYFIECEKQLQVLKPNVEAITKKDLALMLLESEQEKEALLLENKRLQPRSDYIDVVFSTNGLLTMSEAAKSLGLRKGRNTLYILLREKGVLFMNSKEPKQDFINRGYFAMKQTTIEYKKGDILFTKIEPQTMVTQKGLAYIAKILNVVNTYN